MPILAGARPAPPPPAPQAYTQPAATWYAPDGTVWPLMTPDLGWVTIHSPRGLDDNPITITSDPHPRGGTRHRHTQPQPRIITWPIRVWGDTSAELLQRWRALADAFMQTEDLGPGVLEVIRPGSTSPRHIRARYQGGFDDDLEYAAQRQAIITLYCEDPYWYDPTPVTIRREYAPGVDFLAPYPSVSSSQVLGGTTLHNPGHAIAWPTWTITGPAAKVTATLVATGESWELDPTLVDGQLDLGDTVVISTDPPRIRYYPYSGDPQVWTGAINWPSAVLWGLPRGTSEVVFQVDAANEGTSITLQFYARYRTT